MTNTCELCHHGQRIYGRLCEDCIAMGRILLDVWRNILQARELCEYVRLCRRHSKQPEHSPLPATKAIAVGSTFYRPSVSIAPRHSDGLWHVEEELI
jgi:hypothetical protein